MIFHDAIAIAIKITNHEMFEPVAFSGVALSFAMGESSAWYGIFGI